MTQRLKIGIIGVGMVGTPLKRYFEEVRGHRRGKDLFLYDIDPQKGYFDNVNKADVVFICVPTPSAPDGSADLSAVESALKLLEKSRKVIVVKSTVPPGTIERLQKKYPHHKILFNPEFLTERRVWEDLINPDRQIVAYTASSKALASHILNILPAAYFSSPGTLGTYNFMRINATEAELGKYGGNLFGALKVTFGNILKDFCDAVEIVSEKDGIKTPVNYINVRAMLAHDRRIGDSWLDVEHGGYRGFGGYCLIKDTSALIASGEKFLKKLPEKSKEYLRLAAGLNLLKAMREYNRTLLATQGLSENDVAVHDYEWIQRKMKNSEIKTTRRGRHESS